MYVNIINNHKATRAASNLRLLTTQICQRFPFGCYISQTAYSFPR